MMRRREFITLLGGAAAAWSLPARAQQPGMPVIGILGATTEKGYGRQLTAFRQGLNETGFVERRNVAFEYRWADNQYDRLPTMAADLVRRQVDVIATMGGTPSAFAAKAATTIIPIIFHSGVNPVEAGLVVSLSRPGGNLTGVVTLATELGPKRLELLHELLPSATSMALFNNPTNAAVSDANVREAQASALTLGIELHVLRTSSERDIEAAFATLTRLRIGGVVINADGFLVSQSEQIAALALRNAVPAIFQFRAFAEAGGLMSYGESQTDSYRLAGAYTGRVLKGEKPAGLPVQQATKVELIINMKTAKALGITVPLSLLGRADEVIE
jgi:putative ABC transport system substrate-binding protein